MATGVRATSQCFYLKALAYVLLVVSGPACTTTTQFGWLNYSSVRPRLVRRGGETSGCYLRLSHVSGLVPETQVALCGLSALVLL